MSIVDFQDTLEEKMYNTKLMLVDGREIYPGYLDKEKRAEIRNKFSNKREYMWCGCRNDKKLFYRISEDLKLYPEHNNYVHDRYCSRFKTETGAEERKTGYVLNEDDGEVTAYLTFNPKTLSLNEEIEKEEDNPELGETEEETDEIEVVIEKDEGTTKKEEKKDPKLSFASLVRSINVDTFTEKILNNRVIETRETFSKMVYFRMKKVRPSKMKKAIGDLTLEKDGVKFMYAPFAGAFQKEERGLKKCYMCNYGSDGKIYNNFVFPDTMEKAIKEFVKMYGIEPNEDTMIAGLQYIKKSRKRFEYKVLGRIHLFQISNLGIYCRSLVEKDTFDTLCEITKKNKNIIFWVPPDDESVGCIISIKNKNKKILLLFRTKKNERITYNESLYVPLVAGEDEPITEQIINNIINEIN